MGITPSSGAAVCIDSPKMVTPVTINQRKTVIIKLLIRK